MGIVRRLAKLGILISISMIIFTGCAGKKPQLNLPLQERFDRGLEYMEKGKYYNAQQEFQIVILSGSHTELGDDAQFHLAEAFFENKEYLLAISEYERLTRSMKYSEYVEKARWRICEAYVAESPKYYHDQASTDKALQKLQEFIDEYPNSEYNDDAKETIKNLRNKLALKLYNSGQLYLKLLVYDSAIITFEDLLARYYDTDYAEQAHIGIIRSHIFMKNYTDAQNHYDENSYKIVSADVKKMVEQLLESIKSENK